MLVANAVLCSFSWLFSSGRIWDTYLDIPSQCITMRTTRTLSSSLLGVINDAQNSSKHPDGYLLTQKLFSTTCVHWWWKHYLFCHCPRNSTRRLQMPVHSSIHWGLLGEYAEFGYSCSTVTRKLTFICSQTADSHPGDAKRKERNERTTYEPVVPFKSWKTMSNFWTIFIHWTVTSTS